jgi:hypothetical protein
MYKFYTIPDFKVLENIIGDKPTLKFSSASNLNDPFELKFNLVIDPFASGQQEAFLKANTDKTLDDFKEWQQAVAHNEGWSWYLEQQQRAHLSQLITICSFSKTNTNNLMWSHYANNHKGICIKYSKHLFEKLNKANKYFILDKVDYSTFPPDIFSLDSESTRIRKMIFNKQLEWQYEQEYRAILLSNHETDFIEIESEDIEAIYIGARAKEIAGKVLDICTRNNIDYYQSICIGKTYEVQFEKPKHGTFYIKTFWD